MSTDLYGIRVLEVDPPNRRLRLRVFVVYYETNAGYHQPIPEDRSFFVRVLCDKEALGDDISDAERFDEDYVNRNAFRYIDSFQELSRANDPIESYEGYSDFYYERDGGWQDEDKLAQAEYDVFVTKSEYLNPFGVGESWGTTSYETDSDALSLEQYPDIPEFSSGFSFKPFADLKEEASVADFMNFSSDGSRVIIQNNDGGFRVFSTSDWTKLAEVLETGYEDFPMTTGWTRDGNVAYQSADGWTAFDIASGARAPLTEFGIASNPAATRLVFANEDQGSIRDGEGNELFTFSSEEDMMIWAAFDREGDTCALLVEGEPLSLVDLKSKTSREFPGERMRDVALNPDASYILAADYDQGMTITDVASGEIIRRGTRGGNIPGPVAWSPDGKMVLAAWTNDNGYNSRVTVNWIGSEMITRQRSSIVVPERHSRDIIDIARLYVNRTEEFSSGWDSHLDDDMLDFHLALVRMGLPSDLPAVMKTPYTRIAARAYETIIAHERGETDRAEQALGDARDILNDNEIPEWSRTNVYAPLAAAYSVMGREEEANTALENARHELDDEANPFQNRAIFARALITMGRRDEVRQIIKAEKPGGWVGDFHARLFSDLADARDGELLELAFDRWKPESEHVEMMNARLNRLGCTDIIAASEWFTEQVDDPDNDSQDEDAETHGLDMDGDPDDAFQEPALNRKWEQVYGMISETKPTRRDGLYGVAIQAALKGGDLDIALDMLGRIPCTDMNSPGLRALQGAFKKMAGEHYRIFHP